MKKNKNLDFGFWALFIIIPFFIIITQLLFRFMGNKIEDFEKRVEVLEKYYEDVELALRLSLQNSNKIEIHDDVIHYGQELIKDRR